MRKAQAIIFFVLLSVAPFLFAATVTSPEQIPSYWSSADGKSSEALWKAISSQTNKGFKTLGYKGLWSAYKTTDVYPSDASDPDYVAGKAGKIWDMYGDCTFTYSTDQCGTYKNVCDCYNREHTIPQSWFGGTTSGIGCDIFHVLPTDGKINGVRGNNEFGEVNGGEDWNGNKSGSAGSWSTDKKTIASKAGETVKGSGTVFEPLDKFKGDFARGYMGTIIKWQQSNITSGNSFFSGSYTASSYFGLTKKAVVLLMKWHREDPVSQKEIDRNNGIQQTQGNRNPFIDYPYLAEFIWGEHAGETVNMAQLMPSTDPEFVPGKSDGWRGGDTPVEPDPEAPIYELLWMANGQQLRTDNVEEGKTVSSMPAAPASCSAESNVFVGWTTTAIKDSLDNAPAVLYTTVKEIPAVTQDMSLYAVYAKETMAEGAAPATYIFNAENQDGWSNTASKSGSYWLLDQGKELTSPEVDLSGLNSIKVNMRTYGGTQYDQLTVSSKSGTITTLEASKGSTLTDYEWTNTQSLSGKSPVTFSTNYGSKKGIGVASVVINVTGAGVTYSRYITSCQSTEEVMTPTSDSSMKGRATKVLVGGQLYILVNDALFTITGQRVK